MRKLIYNIIQLFKAQSRIYQGEVLSPSNPSNKWSSKGIKKIKINVKATIQAAHPKIEAMKKEGLTLIMMTIYKVFQISSMLLQN